MQRIKSSKRRSVTIGTQAKAFEPIKTFAKNVKSVPAAFKEVGKAIKQKRFGKMVYDDMNPTGKAIFRKMKKIF